MKLTKEQSNDILEYIIKRCDDNAFEIGVNKGSFQFLYEKHKNYLLSNYFNGDTLRYSICMSDLMNTYNEHSLRLHDLNNFILSLKGKIRLSKKYKGDINKLNEMISDYNYFISEFRDKSRNIKKLLKKYGK